VRVRQSNPSQLFKAAGEVEKVSLTTHEELQSMVLETSLSRIQVMREYKNSRQTERSLRVWEQKAGARDN
jgi:hypothetical protein